METSIAVVKMVWVVKLLIFDFEDDGTVNHLTQVIDKQTFKDVVLAYSGPKLIGREGELIRVEWSGECWKAYAVHENEGYGPRFHNAWACDATSLKVLEHDADPLPPFWSR